MQIWTPNQLVQKGRFTIQKILGSGGFGITYTAIDQRTGKLLVIKTLKHVQQIKQDFQQRQVKFMNEALQLANCKHPHVVQVHEIIDENGLLGIVMEYIDGVDLNTYVDERGRLSEDEALRYIDQVGQALEYVHSQGFLHRDIKPHNIILRRGKQEAVLIDFGLAREFGTGEVLSMMSDRTEGYTPIEQYNSKGNFGAYTDVYGLAATLYFLLTGNAPKAADEEIVTSFRRKYDHQQLPPPKEYNPYMSDRINQAILKGMELEPQNRPQTVLEFRTLLDLGSGESSSIKLITAKMDYTQLRDLLAAGKWREADQETGRVMLAVARRKKEGWLNAVHIDNFPCEDLSIMNQLWVKYSHGRFGFSEQKRIYQSLGGTRSYDEKIWQGFGDRVGWRRGEEWLYYKDLTFNLSAPVAHLPTCCPDSPHIIRFGGGLWFWFGSLVISSLASRLAKCNI